MKSVLELALLSGQCEVIVQSTNCPLATSSYQATAIAVAITVTSASCSRNFQPNAINWSYRKRGSVPRTQIYRKRNAKTFAANQNTGRIAVKICEWPNTGPCHPPKNRSVATHATVIMFAYSA